MAYTHKMVDGELIPLTPEEIAECEAAERRGRQQQNISNSGVGTDGKGPSIIATLTPPIRKGPM